LFPVYTRFRFGGCDARIEDAAVVVVGVPYYPTAGVRPVIDGPALIRYFSHEVEDNSLLVEGEFYSSVRCCDIGDVLPGSLERVGEDLESTVARLLAMGKRVLILGGEHTFTYYAVRGARPRTVVVLDAHLDAREELRGERLCYATFMRALAMEGPAENVVYYGARAYSAEEEEVLRSTGRRVVLAGCPGDLERVREPVYLSIDLDVLDPSHMRLVQAPEPLGLGPSGVVEAMKALLGKDVVCVDVMELSPYAIDIPSAALAARLAFEATLLLARSRGEV